MLPSYSWRLMAGAIGSPSRKRLPNLRSQGKMTHRAPCSKSRKEVLLKVRNHTAFFVCSLYQQCALCFLFAIQSHGPLGMRRVQTFTGAWHVCALPISCQVPGGTEGEPGTPFSHRPLAPTHDGQVTPNIATSTPGVRKYLNWGGGEAHSCWVAH